MKLFQKINEEKFLEINPGKSKNFKKQTNKGLGLGLGLRLELELRLGLCACALGLGRVGVRLGLLKAWGWVDVCVGALEASWGLRFGFGLLLGLGLG